MFDYGPDNTCLQVHENATTHSMISGKYHSAIFIVIVMKAFFKLCRIHLGPMALVLQSPLAFTCDINFKVQNVSS